MILSDFNLLDFEFRQPRKGSQSIREPVANNRGQRAQRISRNETLRPGDATIKHAVHELLSP
jgi:hypothetical protein